MSSFFYYKYDKRKKKLLNDADANTHYWSHEGLSGNFQIPDGLKPSIINNCDEPNPPITFSF